MTPYRREPRTKPFRQRSLAVQSSDSRSCTSFSIVGARRTPYQRPSQSVVWSSECVRTLPTSGVSAAVVNAGLPSHCTCDGCVVAQRGGLGGSTNHTFACSTFFFPTVSPARQQLSNVRQTTPHVTSNTARAHGRTHKFSGGGLWPSCIPWLRVQSTPSP